MALKKDTAQSGKASERFVLVGTYKGDQLDEWRGWYNYPISDDDKICAEDAAKITELWLFKGTKDQRNYKASFVGIKSRKELIDDYGYPAKGKAHSDKYLLFKTDFKYQHKGDIPKDAGHVAGAGRTPARASASRTAFGRGIPVVGPYRKTRRRRNESEETAPKNGGIYFASSYGSLSWQNRSQFVRGYTSF